MLVKSVVIIVIFLHLGLLHQLWINQISGMASPPELASSAFEATCL
jgi:hypothetical protein